jgi:hypothetical protein
MCPNWWYYIGIFVGKIGKITIILTQTGWSIDRNFTPGFLENENGVVS